MAIGLVYYTHYYIAYCEGAFLGRLFKNALVIRFSSVINPLLECGVYYPMKPCYVGYAG